MTGRTGGSGRDAHGGTPFGVTLRRLAAAGPDRPALTCGGVTLGRAQLLERVRRVAGRLGELGVGEGSVVTICLANGPELIETALAAWWLGATPQPISDRLPAAERTAIIDLADPGLVVGAPATGTGGRPALSAADVAAAATAGTPSLAEPGVAPVWKVVTSGGSTGRPKLIVATQPALTESVTGLGGMLRLPEDGCVLVTAPLTHNAPLVTAVASLLLGSHLVVMERFDARDALRLAAEHRVGWLYLVPTMMQRIWRLPEGERLSFDLSALDVAFHMAAPCPQWLKRAWIDWLGADRVLELYGGTELQAMTVVTGEEWLEHPGSVGRPVLGEIECRDPSGRRLPPGETGELWMRRGPGQPPPYRYIGATARQAEGGWESLGDHGHVDEDGYVHVTDREADMIVVGGANVYPAEVEAALDEHPAVRSSCVVGLPQDDLGHVPHALVELAAPVTDEDLLTHLRERLAPYKLPRSVERVDRPLRDDAGKVRRGAVRAERLARLPEGAR